MGGPSPRAWGKPENMYGHIVDRRTIPTGVGKTWSKPTTRVSLSDHPHGRGENSSKVSHAVGSFGPSPRAWGKHREVRQPRPGIRTIPTGVGKTPQPGPAVSPMADHPHGRGENSGQHGDHLGNIGPSPRAWGKLDEMRGGGRMVRTIPTGVGKTKAQLDGDSANADHPHGRGENDEEYAESPTECGPSPRAWGKLPRRRQSDPRVRTIPTGVGKTQTLVQT